MIVSKLIFTLLLSWLVAHISAHPESAFAEWGEKVLGSVGRLWFMIAMIFGIPIYVLAVYWIWTNV